MKKLLKRSFFLTFLFLLSTGSALAQDEQVGGPVYVVQSGDTLSIIAVRWGVPQQEIVSANQLENPDQLFAGQELVLPGIDWIDGVLIPQQMPYGETLLSLSRQYRVDPQLLARLSRLTSPSQLFVSYPITMPTQRGEDTSNVRNVVSPGVSMLEMAAANGRNPWTMVGENSLSGTWDAISGDVLLIPGTDQPGPGALPSPITRLEFPAEGLVQGRTVVVNVNAEGDFALQSELMGNQLDYFRQEDGTYSALMGVSALAEPGLTPFTMSGEFGYGTPFSFTQSVAVVDGGYGFETLTVDLALIDIDLTNSESEFIRSLTAEVTPEKLWSGFFQAPSPYTDTINSTYGTRRSYNGGVYETYHSGIDFGGGLGVEIFSPAVGEVVFAGPLEVRGNATIINHGWGVYTGYWHQSEIRVQEGDIVAPGQVIGIVGNTGRVTGAHLHWEIWVNGVQVDPIDWLARPYP
ncbi:MAG: peptidoglycan DD-metalloendopeptidase family protein [Chloroflexi bacterium]|nr:peptidoglycan DD-metalloendopeptidase family protein [Chloroflexota bacterium]